MSKVENIMNLLIDNGMVTSLNVFSWTIICYRIKSKKYTWILICGDEDNQRLFNTKNIIYKKVFDKI